MMAFFIWFCSFLAFTQAVPTPLHHVVHEKRDYTPSRWIKRDRVPGQKKFPMRIGLAQSNLEKAHEYLMDM